MKYPSVILLTLFVLQIYALPYATITRSRSLNDESKSENVSEESKGTVNESSFSKATEKELKASSDDLIGILSADKKEVQSNNKETLTENIRLASKSPIDASSTSTKTEKDKKSISENAKAESKSTSESNNIPTVTKADQKSSSQETPSSRSNEEASGSLIIESTDTAKDSSGILTHTKIETIQRPPSYYYDMFNIPIAALQAVSNFLGGTPSSNTYIRPPAPPKPPVSKEYLRSPAEVLSEGAEEAASSSTNTDSPTNVPNTPVLNLINQISQLANNRPGMLLRLPTIQDIINIPISTLNAVSYFLAQNYATQPVPAVNSPPAVAAGIEPSEVPIESAAGPKRGLLKAGQILQSLENIPDHSTLIGVTEELVSTTNDQATNAVHIKQVLIANPQYYQDMINIPIATLKAVNDFLTTVYVDPSLALASATQGNKITTAELSSPSTKASQPSAGVTADSKISKISAEIPQV